MASTTMIETVTITRPLKLLEVCDGMQPHGNLTASYLWQPGELARRMMGERPAPVPPTRDLWPPPQQPLSISTLHIAYLHEDASPRRASSTIPLSTHPYNYPTPVPVERDYRRPRVCTVGTNTDPPPTILNKIRHLVKRDRNLPEGCPPPIYLSPSSKVCPEREDEGPARRALNGIKRAISSARNRIAPGSESVDSPKIVYDISKPGDRMVTTFGVKESRRWWKLPSRTDCSRRMRNLGGRCYEPQPRRPPRRQPHPPRLQITQV